MHAEEPHSVYRPERPVMLVHGYADTSLKMQPMARYLRRLGWTVFTPYLSPCTGAVGVDALAGQLDAYINKECGHSRPIDLVGFSMGGMVSRYYVQRLGGARRVKHLITIAAPHHGTWLAYILGNRVAVQLRPHSAFLNDLNRDADTLGHLRFTSIWTPLDLMIVPANSSHLGIGKEKLIWMPAHPLMVWSGASHRAVAAALRE